MYYRIISFIARRIYDCYLQLPSIWMLFRLLNSFVQLIVQDAPFNTLLFPGETHLNDECLLQTTFTKRTRYMYNF